MPKFLSSSANGPSKDELKAAIDVCLKENPKADAKTVKSLLKQNNPTWSSIPERRVKKILSSAAVAEAALQQESAATTTKKASKRFSFAKGASKLFKAAPAATVDDTATAPLDSPPGEQAVSTVESLPPTPTEPSAVEEKVVVATEPVMEEGLVTAASQEENAHMYKDDNDGKRDDCAVCQACTLM